MHLQNTSPAINAGNPSVIPASTEKDIDGDNRANGIVDIGADEYYGISLPLNSLLFTAACENQKSKLNWSVSSEMNNDFFAIEKSLNGSDWKQIGSIKSQGNSSNTHNYSYSDEEKIHDVSYYRLKQFNLDGTFSYSKIISAKSCTESLYVFTLSPNPASQSIVVKLNGISEKQQVQIFNVLGAVVKEVEFSQTTQINITDLRKGIYFIKLKNFPTQAQKFIKE